MVGLSFSDRAPGLAFVRVRWFGRMAEARSGLDLLDRSDIPLASDSVGHFLMWGLAGFLGWFAIGRRDSGLFLIAGLGAISAGVEYAQPLLSSTRSTSLEDLVANIMGITLGVLGGWMITMTHRGLRWVLRIGA